MTAPTGHEQARVEVRLRMSALAQRMTPGHPLPAVERADMASSMTDLRTALCLAMGVPIEDIHPGTGHNLTWESYLRSHRDWVNFTEMFGWKSCGGRHCVGVCCGRFDCTARQCTQAGDRWARMRPEYVEKLPWPTPGVDPERSAEADRRLAEANRNGHEDSWWEAP